MNIGLPSYLNALPYRLWLEKEKGITLTLAPPTQINALFKQKQLDCALISSVETFHTPYHLFPFGIAAEKEILSVNLYVKEELSSLDGITIGVTPESATSVALLKLLCRHHWKVNPHFEPSEKEKKYEAFLLIGDKALALQTLAGYRRIDLATSWHELTSLPFVFALFAARESFPFDFPEINKEELLRRASQESPLPLSLLDRYYSLCRYRLEDREFQALRLFKDYGF